MADPISDADLAALRDTLALVVRTDMEGVETADLGAVVDEDADAVVAAANTVFGLVDLIDAQAQQISQLKASISAPPLRSPQTMRVASGSQLWGQRGRRN